jgi:hypothetical protein
MAPPGMQDPAGNAAAWRHAKDSMLNSEVNGTT